MVKQIYLNKWQVKRYSPYIYAGENTPEYFNLHYSQSNTKERLGQKLESGSERKMILGIESSFDDSCAGIVSSCGSVLANSKRRLEGDKFDLQDAPIRARNHHRENLPIVVKEALETANVCSMSELEAIAVTIGPG